MLYLCRQYRERRKTAQGHVLVRHREFEPLRTAMSLQNARVRHVDDHSSQQNTYIGALLVWLL
jgi:hypothetical protein